MGRTVMPPQHGPVSPESSSIPPKEMEDEIKPDHQPDDIEQHLDHHELPQGRQLGVLSASFLMANRVVGTGVFSTTSTILDQSGSVGMSLM